MFVTGNADALPSSQNWSAVLATKGGFQILSVTRAWRVADGLLSTKVSHWLIELERSSSIVWFPWLGKLPQKTSFKGKFTPAACVFTFNIADEQLKHDKNMEQAFWKFVKQNLCCCCCLFLIFFFLLHSPFHEVWRGTYEMQNTHTHKIWKGNYAHVIASRSNRICEEAPCPPDSDFVFQISRTRTLRFNQRTSQSLYLCCKEEGENTTWVVIEVGVSHQKKKNVSHLTTLPPPTSIHQEQQTFVKTTAHVARQNLTKIFPINQHYLGKTCHFILQRKPTNIFF